MKKIFISSDIHGYFDYWMVALDRLGYEKDNDNHIIAVCGDLIDRGPFPRKCIRFVNNLPDHRKILIRGNHEVLANEVIKRGEFGWHDWHNGTADTIQQLSEYATDPYAVPESEIIESFSNNPEWIKYYNSTVYYKEIGDYILTHGWIPYGGTYEYPVYESNWREKSFDSAIWVNGMDMWNKGVRVPNKTVICGHFHAAWGHENIHHVDPRSVGMIEFNSAFKDTGIICLDSRVPLTHFLNVEVIEIEDDLMYI